MLAKTVDIFKSAFQRCGAQICCSDGGRLF